ncbi:MAG: hypothetical protein DUD28_02960 [Lactobacillus sp.]|nr:MAG: hypothetical protein DUD28_02960 [Lactobacillus sp.]
MKHEELVALKLDDTKNLMFSERYKLSQLVLEHLQNRLSGKNTLKYRVVVETAGWANANGADDISIAWRLLDNKAPDWLEQLIEDFFAD